MHKKLAQVFISALLIASAQLVAEQGHGVGRPVAIGKSPTGSLYVLDAQGAVHAVDFQDGKPTVTGTFRLASGWAASDLVSTQVDGHDVLFLSINYGLTGQVSMYSTKGQIIRSWTFRNGVSGIDFDPHSSSLYVASGRTPEVFRVTMAKDSQPEFLAETSGSQRLGPILFDSKNNELLVGDLVLGSIYKVDFSRRKSTVLFTGSSSPQALKLSADGSLLYVADAGTRAIVTYSIAQPKATPRVFAKIPKFRSPSGLAWVGDRLVVSDDGARRLFILSRSGSLEAMLPEAH